MSTEAPIQWYSLDNILSKKCQYNMIIGERSNGKTYAVLSYILRQYKETGKQGALIRRFDDDIKPNKLDTIFNHIVSNGDVRKLFKKHGDWTGITYRNRRFYLCKKVEKEDKKHNIITEDKVVDETPFMYAFSLSQEEDYKENAFPNVTSIFFDEFLTRKFYLEDEFVHFMNLISTIKRKRQDTTIFMCANTINMYAPYFKEMGITHIKSMKKGCIDIYQYGDSDLRVAVEYADSLAKTKKDIDKYFCFDNPKLKMITQGEWEFDIYPHCPMKYKPMDVQCIYFIEFEDELVQCEVVNCNDSWFTFIHRKTTPIRDTDSDIIFSKDVHPNINYRTRISKPIDELGKRIWWFYVADKVFYQDNEVGEMIRNYLLWSNGLSD